MHRQQLSTAGGRPSPWSIYTLVLIAVLLWSAPLKAFDEPWNEPIYQSTLTTAQKQRLKTRQAEIHQIQRLQRTDKGRAMDLALSLVEEDAKIFGESSQVAAQSLFIAGRRIIDTGNTELGLEFEAGQLPIYTKMYGPTNWRIYSILTRLAVLDRIYAEGNEQQRREYHHGWDEYDAADDVYTTDKDKGLEHVEAAVQAFYDSLTTLKVDPSWNPALADALELRGKIHTYWNEYDKAIDDYEQAMSIVRTHVVTDGERVGGFGTHSPRYALVLYDLADAKQRSGRSAEARRLLRQSLDILEECFDGPHRDKASVLRKLGVIAGEDDQQPTKAIELFEAARTQLETCDEPYDYLKTDVLRLLALNYLRLGQTDLAAQMVPEMLKFTADTEGTNSAAYATVKDIEGRVLLAQEKFPEAVAPYAKAASIYFALKGKDDPVYAHYASKLGFAYFKAGRLAEAEPYLRGSFYTIYKRLGTNFLLALPADNYEAFLLAKLRRASESGDFATARQAAQELVDLRVKTNGESTGQVTAHRARLQRIDMLEKLSKEDREAVLQTDLNLEESAKLRDAGRFDEAFDMDRRVLDTRLKQIPKSPYYIAEAQLAVGTDLTSLGQSTEAAQLLRAGITTWFEQNKQQAPYFAIPYYLAISQAMLDAGNMHDANAWLDSIEGLIRNTYGTRGNEFAMLLRQRGRLLEAEGKHAEAEQAYRQALKTSRNLGQTNYAGIAALGVAWNLTQMGAYNEADKFYDQALDILQQRQKDGTASESDAVFRRQLLARQAVLNDRRGKSAEAAEQLDQVLAETPDNDASAEERVFILTALGTAEARANYLAKAMERLTTAVATADKHKLQATEALDRLLRVTDGHVWAFLYDGKTTEAAQTAEQLSKTLAARPGPVDWHRHQAEWLANRMNKLASLSKADQSELAKALAGLKQAESDKTAGKFADGLKQANAAVKSLEKLDAGGPVLDAALQQQALLHDNEGQFAKAGETWKTLIAARRAALEDAPYVAHALIAAAWHDLAGGKAEAAQIKLEQAVAILTKQGQTTSLDYGRAQAGLAASNLALGRLGDAIAANRRAQQCLRPLQSEDPDTYCQTLCLQAQSMLVLTDFQRVVATAQRAADYAQAHCDANSPMRAESTWLLGQAQAFYAGDLDTGSKTLRSAIEESLRTYGAKNPRHARTLISLGFCFSDAGKPDEAALLFDEAKQIAEAALGANNLYSAEAWQGLSSVAAERGKLNEAKKLGERSLAMFEALGSVGKLSAIDLRMQLGDLAYRTGDKTAAANRYQEAMDGSLEFIDAASAAQTDQQQLQLIERMRMSFDRYLSVLSKDVPAAVVYDYVLRWKGIQLAHQLRVQRARQDEKSAALVRNWELLTSRLATVATLLPDPEDEAAWAREVEYLNDQRDLAEIQILKATADKAPACPTADQLVKVLPDDTALVDYVHYIQAMPDAKQPGTWQYEPRYLVFAVRHGKPVQMADAGAADPVEHSVEVWRTTCSDLTKAFFAMEDATDEAAHKKAYDEFTELDRVLTDSSHAISRQLWTPVAEFVGDTQIVLVSPDGTLGAMPFSAVPDSKTGDWLVEKHTLVLVPAARLLPETLKSPPPKHTADQVSLLLFGGIDFSASPEHKLEPVAAIPQSKNDAQGPTYTGSALVGPESFRDLLGTKHEVEGLQSFISQISPNAKIDLLMGDSGTENAYRAQAGKHRWLHFATHGFFMDSMQLENRELQRTRTAIGRTTPPLNPDLLPDALSRADLTVGITFAGANVANDADEDDGILWGLEVGANDLTGVDLAVLSGCETATGRLAVGEGALSLRRTFQLAGVRTIVSTLWPVNDMATNLYMRRFYRNMLLKNMSKAEAVREAQLWFIHGALQGKKDGGVEDGPSIPIETTKLPPRFLLPSFWAPFVINGDWR